MVEYGHRERSFLVHMFATSVVSLLCGCLWCVCGQGTTGQADKASPEKWWLSKDG